MSGQICVGAVQPPLLADLWPSNTGPAIVSPHSLCGAQPDVQLHHEHVVTNIDRGGWTICKHFREKDNSKRRFIKTEDNCENRTRAWGWILEQDWMAVLNWNSPFLLDSNWLRKPRYPCDPVTCTKRPGNTEVRVGNQNSQLMKVRE